MNYFLKYIYIEIYNYKKKNLISNIILILNKIKKNVKKDSNYRNFKITNLQIIV